MTSTLPYFYQVKIEWQTETKAELTTGTLPRLIVSPPPEFGGPEGSWTPEHLFVAAVNSCFLSTFLAIARNSKMEFIEFNCTATGKLEKLAIGGLQITEIILKPILTLPAGVDLGRAERILQKAEKNCLISNSIKTQVRLESEIRTQ